MAGYRKFGFAGSKYGPKPGGYSGRRLPPQPSYPTYPVYNYGRTMWTSQTAKQTAEQVKTGGGLESLYKFGNQVAQAKKDINFLIRQQMVKAKRLKNNNVGRAVWQKGQGQPTQQQGIQPIEAVNPYNAPVQAPGGVRYGSPKVTPGMQSTPEYLEYLKATYNIGNAPRTTYHAAPWTLLMNGQYYPEYDDMFMGDMSPYRFIPNSDPLYQASFQDAAVTGSGNENYGSGGGGGGYYPYYYGGGGGGGYSYKSASNWYNTLVNWNFSQRE